MKCAVTLRVRGRRWLLAFAGMLTVLLALPSPAGAVTVASWAPTQAQPAGSTANVSGCNYPVGAAVGASFTCTSVNANAQASNCTYPLVGVIGPLAGACTVTLSGSLNGLVTQTTVNASSPSPQVSVETFAATCSTTGLNDGSGTVFFQPLSGGTVAETVPVSFQITHDGNSEVTVITVQGDVTKDVDASTPATVTYAGTLLSNGFLVHVRGTFMFNCGADPSSGPFQGSEDLP